MSDALPFDAGPPPTVTTGPIAGTTARPGKLTNLQVLRGVAAASVALMHAAVILGWVRGEAAYTGLFTGRFGVFGVAVFFAISGYLMAGLARTSDPATFLVHRFVRIYPTFLVAVALMLPLQALVGIDMRLDWAALTLAPAGPHFYVLGTEWTLLHEMTFYMGLSALAALGRTRWLEALAVAWLAILAATSLAGSPLAGQTAAPLIHTVLLVAANAAFAGGLLLPAALARGLLPVRFCLAAIPAAAALLWIDLAAPWWLCGLAAVLIVAGLVQTRQVAASGPVRTALVRLGDWSYVLYLVHMPVYAVVYRLAPAWIPRLALFLGAIGAVLAVTAILGPLDVRLHRMLRAWIDRRPAALRRGLAWTFAALFASVAGYGLAQHLIREAEFGQVRAALARLPAGSLRSAASLATGITEAGLASPPGFVGAAESAVRMPSGHLLVAGWAVDLARPSAARTLVVACGGRLAALARPQRFRTDVARVLARPDIGRVRIGFTASVEPGICPDGEPLVALFADAEARLLAGREITVATPERPETRRNTP